MMLHLCIFPGLWSHICCYLSMTCTSEKLSHFISYLFVFSSVTGVSCYLWSLAHLAFVLKFSQSLLIYRDFIDPMLTWFLNNFKCYSCSLCYACHIFTLPGDITYPSPMLRSHPSLWESQETYYSSGLQAFISYSISLIGSDCFFNFTTVNCGYVRYTCSRTMKVPLICFRFFGITFMYLVFSMFTYVSHENLGRGWCASAKDATLNSLGGHLVSHRFCSRE